MSGHNTDLYQSRKWPTGAHALRIVPSAAGHEATCQPKSTELLQLLDFPNGVAIAVA